MPKSNPIFFLHVDGDKPWSWADIQPNWIFTEDNPPGVNQWNEKAREILPKILPERKEE